MISQSNCCQFILNQLDCLKLNGQPMRLLPIRWSPNQIVANSKDSLSDCCQLDGQSLRLMPIRWSVNQLVASLTSDNDIVTSLMSTYQIAANSMVSY